MKKFILVIVMLSFYAVNGQAQDTVFYESVKWSPDQKKICVCAGVRHNRIVSFKSYIISLDHLQIETSFDNALFPVWSSDGKKIAFARRGENKKGAIWVFDLTSGDSLEIIGSEFSNGGVDFSPDGKQVCFTSNRDGKSAVYIANSKDGSGTHRLNQDTIGQYSPAWSPKGDKIVYYCARGDGHDQVYLADLKNNGMAKKITADSTHNYYPSWAPDNQSVVFITTNPAKKDGDAIAVCNIVTGEIRINDKLKGHYASVSPDGEKIAFTGGGFINSGIYIAGLDGSNMKCITEGLVLGTNTGN